MKKMFSICLAISCMLFAAAMTVSCGPAKKVLYVYNWGDYISPDVVKSFEKEHNCKVSVEAFDSNEAMYAKLKQGGGGYDIIVPSTYMADMMFDQKMIMKFDKKRLPNLQHVDSYYTAKLRDKDMDYAVPYLMSFTGIGYNTEKVKDFVPSWKMFERTDLKGRTVLLNDMRECLGAALIALGYSPNSVSEEEIDKAAELAVKWSRNIAKFDVDEAKRGLISGEFWLIQSYSGDMIQAKDENDKIAFALPVEGAIFTADCFCIPSDAQNVDLAYEFINYMNRPDVAAKNVEFVKYRSPNTDAMKLVSEELKKNPSFNIPKETLDRCSPIFDLGGKNQLYTKAWDKVKSGKTE